jgi:hypothetical protein
MTVADGSVVTGIAAVGGSLVGGLSSFATTYWAQARQLHVGRLAEELDRREELYSTFNRLAAELLLHALDHDVSEPAKLIELMTLIGRIRLTSSEGVLHAAQQVFADLIATYSNPTVDPVMAIRSPEQLVTQLVQFTTACRAEREVMRRGL